MRELIEELHRIIGDAVENDFGWDKETLLFSAAMIIGNAGEEAITGTVGELKITKEDFEDLLGPPSFVKETPFVESEDMWWGAVEDTVRAGHVFDRKGRPNYGAVVAEWKSQIEEKYGFVPSESKEKSMAEQISDSVKGAAQLMRQRRSGNEVDQEAISKAARLMQAHSAQSRRSNKYFNN